MRHDLSEWHRSGRAHFLTLHFHVSWHYVRREWIIPAFACKSIASIELIYWPFEQQTNSLFHETETGEIYQISRKQKKSMLQGSVVRLYLPFAKCSCSIVYPVPFDFWGILEEVAKCHFLMELLSSYQIRQLIWIDGWVS